MSLIFKGGFRPLAGAINLGSTQLPDYFVPNNDVNAAFSNITYGLAWNSTRGYYGTSAIAGGGWTVSTADLAVPNLSRIKSITATFYSTWDSPVGGLGFNVFDIAYTSNPSKSFGTADANTAPLGQYLYRGDLGDTDIVQVNALGDTWTLTVPESDTITNISYRGNYLATYPATNRGVKDIIVTYY